MPTSHLKFLLKAFLNLFILLFLGLFLIGPKIYADTTSETNQDTIQEDHDTKNLNKILIDYNKDQKKVIDDTEKIIESDDQVELIDQELIEYHDSIRSKSSKLKKIDPGTLKKIKYSEALKVALEPLQKMSEPELVNLLKENSKSSAAAVYIVRYPELSLFAIRLIKDKDAIPFLGKIIDDQDKLIKFIGIMLCTFIFAILLKQFMKKEGRKVFTALGLWLFRFLLISSFRLWLLIYFYGTELSPTFKIATNTFFN